MLKSSPSSKYAQILGDFRPENGLGRDGVADHQAAAGISVVSRGRMAGDGRARMSSSPDNENAAIPFVKASACGNDFLVIDGMHARPDLAALSRRLCDRHNGVGADGIEWLFPATDADVRARLFNADGSEAEISGNGTRCVAAYLAAEQQKERVVVRTGAGLKTCTLTRRADMEFEFETDMGEPQVGDEFA